MLECVRAVKSPNRTLETSRSERVSRTKRTSIDCGWGQACILMIIADPSRPDVLAKGEPNWATTSASTTKLAIQDSTFGVLRVVVDGVWLEDDREIARVARVPWEFSTPSIVQIGHCKRTVVASRERNAKFAPRERAATGDDVLLEGLPRVRLHCGRAGHHCGRHRVRRAHRETDADETLRHRTLLGSDHVLGRVFPL